MAKKHALLIANTEYRDGKLAPLAHPGLAFAELAEALKDPARGAFSQVETLVNANLSNVLGAVDRFFSRKPADAVLLVYVGGHGFVDAQGELFLALKESDRFRLKSTALMAAVLGMNMDQCASPHKLLILDCLYHSPYLDSRGNQAPARIDPAKVFGGRGLPKLILAAADGPGKAANVSGRDSGPKPAGLAAPSTQKIQAVGRDFTRTLAECLRGPSGSLAERTAFTVEDWWNETAAELKAARCEPPTRHAVGNPPVTVLRGASLPRPEMTYKGTGDTPLPLSRFPAEPESDWSQLSGIFPLEMFAPELASPTTETEGKDVAADGDQAVGGTEAEETGGRELPQAPMARMEMRRMEMPRGDATIIADASYLLGADRREEASGREAPARADATLEMEAPNPAAPADAAAADSADPAEPADQPAADVRPDAALLHDLRLPPDLSGEKTLIWDSPEKAEVPGSGDDFSSMRARLLAQEEAERQARLEQESEEAAQRRKLERWKARWEQKQAGQARENPEPEPKSGPQSELKPGPKPKHTPFQARAAAMQKTLYVPPPDSEAESSAPPAPPARPEPAAGVAHAPAVADGLATVIMPKDQFLNTGSHKAVTPLTPGATIIISKEEFLGKADPAAAETRADAASKEERPARPVRARSEEGRDKGSRSKPPKAPKPPRPPREEGSGGAFRRKAALWALAGLLPVGLGLFAVFGSKSGLFPSLGSGTEAPATRKEPTRNPSVTQSSRPKPILPPAAVIDPAEGIAAESSVPAKTDAPAARAPAQPPAPAPAPKPAPTATPAPKPDPALLARQASLRAQRAYQDSIKAVYYRLRQDSLRAARIARDSLLTARAQAKQDSIQAVRLRLDLERNLKAEIAAAKAAVAKARQDSIRAVKDSLQAEAMLKRSVEAAKKAGAESMRGLYNRFALGYPGLKGEVVVSLQVAPDGEIENGSIWTSTTGLTMFDQVVLGNVMEWKLKPFKGSKAKNIDVAIQFPVE